MKFKLRTDRVSGGAADGKNLIFARNTQVAHKIVRTQQEVSRAKKHRVFTEFSRKRTFFCVELRKQVSRQFHSVFIRSHAAIVGRGEPFAAACGPLCVIRMSKNGT